MLKRKLKDKIINKETDLNLITGFMQMKCTLDNTFIPFFNICDILNNANKVKLYNSKKILRKCSIKALFGVKKYEEFTILMLQLIEDLWSRQILDFCLNQKNGILMRLPLILIKIKNISGILLIAYYQKNDCFRGMDYFLIQKISAFIKSSKKLLIANNEIITYNIYKLIQLRSTEKNYRWIINIPHNHVATIEFFKSYLLLNIKPYINNLKSLKINYYLYTDKNYYPKEIKIITIVFNKHINQNIDEILMRFLSNWKKINLDEYYQACFNGFFLIDIKCYNAQKLIMKDLKVPYNLDIARINPNKLFHTDSRNYDFELII